VLGFEVLILGLEKGLKINQVLSQFVINPAKYGL
jgi:hypothetical protein